MMKKFMKTNNIAVLLMFLSGFFVFNPTFSNENKSEGEIQIKQEKQELTVYYFPSGEKCAAIVNLEPLRKELERLDKKSKEKKIVEVIIDKFLEKYKEKCNDCKIASITGAFIEGLDNYGRPDFGSRINLLRVDASLESLPDNYLKFKKDFKQLEKSLSITEF